MSASNIRLHQDSDPFHLSYLPDTQLSCASAFFSTNFADNHHSLYSKQNHHELDLISTEKLSKAMLKYYEGWIANAPGEYKKTLSSGSG